MLPRPFARRPARRTQIVPINLDDVARAALARRGIGLNDPNPFLDPVACDALIQEAHEDLKAHISYGGWMEDRSTLWRGSYLDKDELYLHLGIDVNVPAYTRVEADWPCEVLRIDCDTPEEHGWGTRVIVRPFDTDVVLLYAHLAPNPEVSVGEHISLTTLGMVGGPEDNGGWYTHVHVQAIRADYYEELLRDDLRALDGYGKVSDKDRLEKLFPDPTPWIKIP